MTSHAMANKDEANGTINPEPTHGGNCYTPRVDIVEAENELTLYADVPGLRPEDVNIRYENGRLEIHGKCPPRGENLNYLLNEYGVGDFYRAFSISDEFDASKITASCKQGVLTVRLPKSEAILPRRITVTA